MAVNFLVCWSAFSDEKVTCWHCFEFVPKVSLCHLNSLLFCRPHFFSSSKLFPPRGQIITSSYFLPLLFALLLFPVVLPPHRSTRHNFPTRVNTLSLSPLITGLLQSLFHYFYALCTQNHILVSILKQFIHPKLLKHRGSDHRQYNMFPRPQLLADWGKSFSRHKHYCSSSIQLPGPASPDYRAPNGRWISYDAWTINWSYFNSSSSRIYIFGKFD